MSYQWFEDWPLEKLLTYVTDPSTKAPRLTFAAEALGLHPSGKVEPTLRALLKHENLLVREGAICGIDMLFWDDAPIEEETMVILREMAEKDPSPTIRSSANAMVEVISSAANRS